MTSLAVYTRAILTDTTTARRNAEYSLIKTLGLRHRQMEHPQDFSHFIFV